jgi:hypothetical protein
LHQYSKGAACLPFETYLRLIGQDSEYGSLNYFCILLNFAEEEIGPSSL